MTHPDFDADDDALDEPLLRAVAALREPVAAHPAARERLRIAVRAEAAASSRAASVSATPAVQRSRVRWFTSRSLQTSPLGLLAAASLLIVGTALITARWNRAAGGATAPAIAGRVAAPAGAGALQVVRFTLAAPAAQRVSLVGDFNGWDPAATALQQQDGTWTVVIPVTPGRHQYGFVIDGSTWIADPAAARSADSDFGSSNSVMYVGS